MGVNIGTHGGGDEDACMRPLPPKDQCWPKSCQVSGVSQTLLIGTTLVLGVRGAHGPGGVPSRFLIPSMDPVERSQRLVQGNATVLAPRVLVSASVMGLVLVSVMVLVLLAVLAL